MANSWYVYILECLDGSFYTGVTTDVEKRMQKHSLGQGSKYVAKKGFKQLLAAVPCGDRSEACKAEYAIKQLPRHEKLDWLRELDASKRSLNTSNSY